MFFFPFTHLCHSSVDLISTSLFPIEILLCSLEDWKGDSDNFAILSIVKGPKDQAIEVLVPPIELYTPGI